MVIGICEALNKENNMSKDRRKQKITNKKLIIFKTKTQGH